MLRSKNQQGAGAGMVLCVLVSTSTHAMSERGSHHRVGGQE